MNLGEYLFGFPQGHDEARVRPGTVRIPGTGGFRVAEGASGSPPRFLPGEETTVSLLSRGSEDGMQGKDPWEEGPDTRDGNQVILVVEDEPAIRTLARRMLERSGFQVFTAADGVEALEILETNGENIHLVFSDLEMPRMGGVELFQRLRERGMRIPFILASGYQNVAGLQEVAGQWNEEVVHLQKPWTRADILEAVNVALAWTAP